jgi:hypothetical protein
VTLRALIPESKRLFSFWPSEPYQSRKEFWDRLRYWRDVLEDGSCMAGGRGHPFSPWMKM